MTRAFVADIEHFIAARGLDLVRFAPGQRKDLVTAGYLRPRPDSSAYVQYVNTMHARAAKLNVLPEVIEYYLWAEATKSGSPLWPACQAQHALDFP
jgi:hypothetical protein